MPLACLITQIFLEAETLTGLEITNEDECVKRRGSCEKWERPVLIKEDISRRGQRSEVRGQRIWSKHVHRVHHDHPVHDIRRQAIDVLDDSGSNHHSSRRVDSTRHLFGGTGCMLSSAIAACLARRTLLEKSVRAAKQFVADAIRYAPELGPDPVTLELTKITRLGELSSSPPKLTHVIETFSIFTSDVGRSERSASVVAIALTTFVPR